MTLVVSLLEPGIRMGGGRNLQKSPETGMQWMGLAKRRSKHEKKDRGNGGMLIYVWREGGHYKATEDSCE